MKNVVQDLTSAGLDWDREKWRGSVASKFIRGGEKNAVKYADEIIVLSRILHRTLRVQRWKFRRHLVSRPAPSDVLLGLQYNICLFRAIP